MCVCVGARARARVKRRREREREGETRLLPRRRRAGRGAVLDLRRDGLRPVREAGRPISSPAGTAAAAAAAAAGPSHAGGAGLLGHLGCPGPACGRRPGRQRRWGALAPAAGFGQQAQAPRASGARGRVRPGLRVRCGAAGSGRGRAPRWPGVGPGVRVSADRDRGADRDEAMTRLRGGRRPCRVYEASDMAAAACRGHRAASAARSLRAAARPSGPDVPRIMSEPAAGQGGAGPAPRRA